MPPRLYLETTIPSYLVARRSALARISTDQQTTQDWWDFRRHEYELFVSAVVMREAARGDAEFAGKRLAVLAGIPLLADTPESDALAGRLLMGDIIPPAAAPDAFHIALAAVHRMEYLLTWNCAHIHNLKLERRIAAACQSLGCECPLICSPAELLEV